MKQVLTPTALAFSTAVLCGAIATTASATAVVNGGFESGAGADADNWNEIEVFGGGLGATATADRDATMPFAGTNAMFLEVVGANDFGPVAEIQQQTLVGSINGGDTYDFSFQSKGVAGPGSVGFYEVLWFDGDGSNGGGPQGSATGLQNYALGGSYSLNQSLGLLAPTAADSVLVQIRLVTGAFAGASGSAYIDDVVFALQGGGPPPTPFPTAGNTVNNPGFELGTGGDADGWDEIAGPNGGPARDASMPANGQQAMYISFDNINNAAAGGAYFAQQVSAIGTVDDTQDYTLAFRAKADSTDFTGQDMFAQIQWLSSSSGFLGETLEQLVPKGLNTEYQEFVFENLDAPDGADQYLVRFQVSAGAVNGIANGLYVDDVYVGVVPEPSSLALIGLGGLALMRRRRSA